jgi:hypothetical protein
MVVLIKVLRENLFLLLQIKPQFLSCTSCRLVTILSIAIKCVLNG